MSAQYKVIRINNYLLSFGINNSSLCQDDDVNREPSGDEYEQLLAYADEYFGRFFQSVLTKHNCGQFVKIESKVSSKSYKTEKIPNDKYQICVRYSYSDIYFTKDSVLTDDIESCPEIIISTAVRGVKFLEELRKIGNGETPFRAVENSYFQYTGNSSSS